MNMFKKIICIILCIAMVQSLVLTATAAEANSAQNNLDSNSFFLFVSGPGRMEDNGDFRFSFHSSLTSCSRFKPKESSIDVSVTVWLRDIDDTPDWTDPWFPPTDSTKTITVSLYEAGVNGGYSTLVGSFTASANDKKTTHTFSGVDTSREHYLAFASNSTLGDRIYFDGKGNVSNVTVTKKC